VVRSFFKRNKESKANCNAFVFFLLFLKKITKIFYNEKLFFGLLLLISSSTFGQTSKLNGEHFPVFNGCENENKALVEACFYKQVQDFIFTHFKVPEKLSNQNFNGFVTAVFEVNETGKFQLLYVDASEKELVTASQNVFNLFPVIAPPTFNGVPTYGKYTVKINIPLQSAAQIATEKEAQRIADVTNFAKHETKHLQNLTVWCIKIQQTTV